MSRLSQDTLAQVADGVARPAYDRTQTGLGIVHFGIGAFHQAHQAVFTDDAIAKSGGDWGICGVSLNCAGSRRRLKPQDGLYTLAIRDVEASHRIVGAVRHVLFAKDDAEQLITILRKPSTKFVTLTITEKGYALTGDGELDLSNPMIQADIATPDTPSSAMGYIVLATRLRRDAGVAPLTIVSCDNLPGNGDKLKAACIRLAEQKDKGLAAYIRKQRFPNTMVDSITPATNSDVLDSVQNAIGVDDQAAVQREAFAQWVIEDNLPADRPDWAGAGATITNDVHGFEMTKLRILNGAHSTLTYLGLLAGLESVEDAISHPDLRDFVDGLIQHETIPTISAPEGLDLAIYWSRTIARFENPHIRHLIEQISHDGSQKIPARIVPVIAHHAEKGTTAHHACFVVAAWIVWNRQRRAAGQNPTDGYLTQTSDRLPHPSTDLIGYIDSFLAREDIFPDLFREAADIRQSIQKAAAAIEANGVADAAKDLTP